jgi:hopene-associated glycosyltransferase HpnB
MPFLDIISSLNLCLWIYIAFFYGRKNFIKDKFFWSNSIIFEDNIVKTKLSNKKICVIIPARNEDKYIEETLLSIKNQNISTLHTLVVNDNSTDNTQQVLKNFKRDYKNLQILNGQKLPQGWVGKVWALKQGVDEANKRNFEYFLFIDSDIYLDKGVVTKSVHFVEDKNLVMFSLMAKLNCKYFWEKLLIPPFIFFFQKLFPFGRVNDPKDKISAAAGGFILCKSQIFKQKNLYESIQNKVIDDCNIAKFFKKEGTIWLGLTNLVKSRRTYKNLGEIWKMVSRTAFEQLNFSIIILLICCLGMFLIYLTPYIILAISVFDLEKNLMIINLLTIFLMTIVFIPIMKFYKVDQKYLAFIPLFSSLYIIMTCSSAINHFSKKGNKWKGRSY